MEEQKKCCCHHGGEISDVEARVRTRTDEEYKKLLNRLNRIEGQIRGVKSMLDRAPSVGDQCGTQQLQQTAPCRTYQDLCCR